MPRCLLPVVARTAALLFALLAGAMPTSASAQQYFGQNHVQFKQLDWRVLKTAHFDLHYYPEIEEAAILTGRMAERSYARLSRIFNHTFRERKPIILFASRGDFAQNNVTGDLGEGTGGVTDALRQRNMFFFAGDLKEAEHVLAHEMVHQFQYDVFARGRAGSNLQQIAAVNPPLWFMEGMAEFLSIGPGHVATEMVLRDAAINGDIPSVEAMTVRPDLYFPYRFGEALMEYIAARWGDEVIGEIMQATVSVGVDRAVRRHTGLDIEELGEEWKEAMQLKHLPQIAQRERARRFAQPMLNERRTGGANPVYLAPALSPDGRNVAFLSTGSFARAEVFLDLYLADASTGKRIKRLTKSTLNPEFEELRSAYSQSAFTPDGRILAFTAQRQGKDVIYLLDVRTRREIARLDTDLDQMLYPTFSPDGRQIIFTGLKGGLSDLYMIDIDGRDLRRLTEDQWGDHQPNWSPDGRRVAFASERGPRADLGSLRFDNWQISVLDLETGDISTLPDQAGRNLNPQWSPDGESLIFISDRTGTANLFLYDLASEKHFQLTNLVGAVASFTEQSPAISWARLADRLAFVHYDAGSYTVWSVDNPRLLKKEAFVMPSAIIVRADSARTPVASDTTLSRQRALSERGMVTFEDTTGRRMSVYRSGNIIRNASDAGLAATRGAPTVLSVAALLDSAELALPDPTTFTDEQYKGGFRPEYVSRPSVGYAQDNFGRGVFGGTTIVLGDMIGNKRLALAAAINGRVDEAQIFIGFNSLAKRLQYNVGFQQYPIFFLNGATQSSSGTGQFFQTTELSRFILRDIYATGNYPLNRFSRFEIGGSINSIERSTMFLSQGVDFNTGFNTGSFVDSIIGRSTLNYVSPFVAFVSDNTLNGMTAPIIGRRMRFQMGPTLGNARWMHYSADVRNYLPIIFNTLTFATRFSTDISAGPDEMEFPKYIARPFFVRGYDREQFQSQSCNVIVSDPTACSATQLLGSRVAFANAELRFPLIRRVDLGFLPIPLPPVEGLFFYDIGAAWEGGQSLSFRQPDNYDFTKQRYFLSSYGAGVRMNLFNFAIIRWDYAIPRDAADRKGYWMWTLGPSY
jgi:WD40 repeat protein